MPLPLGTTSPRIIYRYFLDFSIEKSWSTKQNLSSSPLSFFFLPSSFVLLLFSERELLVSSSLHYFTLLSPSDTSSFPFASSSWIFFRLRVSFLLSTSLPWTGINEAISILLAISIKLRAGYTLFIRFLFPRWLSFFDICSFSTALFIV